MAKRGRKRNDPPTFAHKLTITDEQMRLLLMWGKGDMSLGLRWLIDNVSPMIVKLEDVEVESKKGGDAQ